MLQGLHLNFYDNLECIVPPTCWTYMYHGKCSTLIGNADAHPDAGLPTSASIRKAHKHFRVLPSTWLCMAMLGRRSTSWSKSVSWISARVLQTPSVKASAWGARQGYLVPHSGKAYKQHTKKKTKQNKRVFLASMGITCFPLSIKAASGTVRSAVWPTSMAK